MIPGNANPLLLASAAAADTAANITKSLRFNDGDSAYLSKTPSSAGNRKKFTFSAWLKKGKTSGNTTIFSAGSDSSNRSHILLNDTNHTLRYFNINSGSLNANVASSAFLRDHSAWYHIVIAVDTSQSTASDRIKIYLNGVQITSFSSSTYPSQNDDLQQNATVAHNIGKGISNAEHFDGYLADVYFIDGSQLDPTSFGAYDDNGVWQAIGYSGTYGTNGFHLLDFENESTVGHDSSGNENDFTANNISTSAGAGNDVLFDVPTNGTQSDTGAGGEVSGNYCTLNPLTSSNYTLSNGNLDVNSGSGGNRLLGTIGVSSGKYYFEAVFNSHTSSNDSSYLVVRNEDGFEAGIRNRTADTQYFTSSGGNLGTYSSSNWSTSETHGFALDCDNNQLKIYKNNTLTATISITAGKTYFPGYFRDGSNGSFTFNFGARAFTYAAPSGFKALCTTNLPTPTVADGADYFDAKTYTGNGSTQSITGFEFSPDWVWYKDRGSTNGHALFDSVRGAQKRIRTMTGAAEVTDSTYLTSFNSDGFTVGSHVTGNTSGSNYIAWCWDAGSSTASNTNGSITSSVRASQTSGFSIVSYTGNNTAGATIGHGLSAAPEVVIYKNRDRSENWGVYSKAVGASKSMYFNLTQIALTADTSPANMYNGTDPSSTVLTVGDAVHVNANTEKIIAYCFAPVAGFSAMGVYTGNGSASEGPFIYTGFKVAFLITKRTDSTTSGDWNIVDTTRGTYNPVGPYLYVNESNAEGDVTIYDLLSNGFRIKESGAGTNANGSTYFYLAFAENPIQANGGLAR